MKRCWTTARSERLQPQCSITSHLLEGVGARQEVTDAGRGVEKWKLLHTVGETANSYIHHGKQMNLKNLSVELPYDLLILLLGLCSQEMKTLTQETCTPLLMAASVTTAKMWKEFKHPLTDKWMSLWCTHTPIPQKKNTIQSKNKKCYNLQQHQQTWRVSG